jgi:ABC-type polysaccharide/polyol phosphate export permease
MFDSHMGIIIGQLFELILVLFLFQVSKFHLLCPLYLKLQKIRVILKFYINITKIVTPVTFFQKTFSAQFSAFIKVQ